MQVKQNLQRESFTSRLLERIGRTQAQLGLQQGKPQDKGEKDVADQERASAMLAASTIRNAIQYRSSRHISTDHDERRVSTVEMIFTSANIAMHACLHARECQLPLQIQNSTRASLTTSYPRPR